MEAGRGQLGPAPKEPNAPERGRRRRRDRRPQEVDPGRRGTRGARRWVVTVVAIGTVMVIALPIVLWARYRMNYVVSRNATVKGSITHVGAQLSGVVTSVEVDAGQRVRAGQVLARFEDHQLQANVLRAKSRLAEATARAASARAQIAAAHSQTGEARARYEQRVPLAKTGAIALDELRASDTNRRTAEAVEMTTIADQRAAQAEVAAAEAELALAKDDLDGALIRAPADGWVVRRIAEPGVSVVVGQPIAELWIGKEVWVEAWIEENHLANVAVGNEVRVTVKPFPNRVFSGVVEAIGVSTDFELPDNAVPQPRNTRMRTAPVVCIRVRLDKSEGLFPGLSAIVGIRRKSPG